MGVLIKYGDVAPEAKENFMPDINNIENFVDVLELQQDKINISNYANPCELYQTVLDSSTESFPEYPENENMGIWSDIVSDKNGLLSEPIVLTLQSEGNYSSQGFTFTFDTNNNVFCNNLNIKWYQGDTLLEDIDFVPNSAFYFCHKKVDFFNKVIITFKSLNMPYNRFKLRVIDYGYGTYFKADELRDVSLIREINPISENIVINVCDFTLDSKTDMEYSFQSKQPLSIFFNDKLVLTTFVSSSRRTGKRLWNVETEDYVGILDGIKFLGGMYEDQNAVELLESILKQANVPYTISVVLNEKSVTGYIPICTCRQAIQKICFAIGAVVDTSNSETLDIFVLTQDVAQHIPRKRIRQGQNFKVEDRVTEIQLTQYQYSKTDEVFEPYNTSNGDPYGENILVEFSEPLYDLKISGGEFVKTGANFAIINSTSGCSIGGKKYQTTKVIKSKKNPNILASDVENIKKIDSETLISESNVDEVLENCYNHYLKTNKVNMFIEEKSNIVKYGEKKYGTFKYGQSVNEQPITLTDMITAETEYLGTLEGRIVCERFNLNGRRMIAKECDMIL